MPAGLIELPDASWDEAGEVKSTLGVIYQRLRREVKEVS
jgi:hypothetical protein